MGRYSLASLVAVFLVTASWALAPPALAGTSNSIPPSIPWGNVACDPPPEGIPDPGTGQQCAYLPVPLDYRNPDGQRILLAVSIVHADPAQRRGVLFLNPGGPGGAGLDMPRIFYFLLSSVLGQEQATAVLSKYDLIGFDPRFVGHSTGATCGLTAQQSDQVIPPLEQDHSFSATAAFVQRVAQGCVQNVGADIVPFATTANTARDMDFVRQALGEQKINYFAWSYGTYLGAVYSSLFPTHTDRVILDSNVDPNWVWREQFRSWGIGGADRWPDFANWAAQNDATYHFGNTPDQVTALYFQLYGSADAKPFSFPDELPDGSLVNGPLFRVLTFFGLEHDSSFPGIAALWQAARGAGSGAASTGPTGATAVTASSSANVGSMTNPSVPTALTPIPPDNKEASAVAILCDDAPWSHSVSQYQQEYNRDSRSQPMFGPLGSHIWPCAFWPNQPVEPPVTITANGPHNILLLQNLRDPNTPYQGAQELHQALGQRSVLVSVDGGGHAIFGFETNSCVNDAAVAYLRDGVLPAQDTFCPAGPPATTEAVDPQRKRVLRDMHRRMTLLQDPY